MIKLGPRGARFPEGVYPAAAIDVIDTTGAGDALAAGYLVGGPEVAMEATLGWYWAANVIGDCGARLHLAHPLGIKAFAYQRVKKDESDARLLADLLRMGRLPEAWVAPPVAVGRKILTLVFYGLRDGEVRCLAEKAA